MTMVGSYADTDYFDEVSSSINLVQSLLDGNQVQLNLGQCKYLYAKLAETGGFLTAEKDKLKSIRDVNDVRRKALLKLFFTVKRAEKLVRNCCCDLQSWLESAVTLAQIKEDIVDILLDLRWWTSMVEIAIASKTWVSTGEQIELELLRIADAAFKSLLEDLHARNNGLEEAAIWDKEQLLKKLLDLETTNGGIIRNDEQQRDYLLAAHVRSRLEDTDLEVAVDQALNVYLPGEILGQGSFGAVMDVRWLGLRCALKILMCLSETEAKSLRVFQHPHIVQFFRYWEAPSRGIISDKRPESDASMQPNLGALKSHILMEQLPTDLDQHIGAKEKNQRPQIRVGTKRILNATSELPMSEDVAIDVMLQVAKAMWHLNNKDVAHRDLKPSNILVRAVSKDEVPELNAGGHLRIKLADFGLAKDKVKNSTFGPQTVNLGTRVYAAPEAFDLEISSGKKFPRKADVWSFGIIFCETLTGEKPYWQAGVRVGELHGRIRKGLRPLLPDNTPEYLKWCIRNCLDRLPEDRPDFFDLWNMVRYAQVRSLGLIRNDHDLFTYNTRNSVRRLHSLKKMPTPMSLGHENPPSLSTPNSIWLIICRISYLLMRRGSSIQSSSSEHRLSSRSGMSLHRSERKSLRSERKSLLSEDKPLSYLVNQVWPDVESKADSKLDVIFFEGNVGRRKFSSCRDTWVQRDKPDVWWPRDWLPKDVKGEIRVLLLGYNISGEDGVEGVVEELQRHLVFSGLWNRENTWQCPIVLVGHSLGCVLIEKLVVALDERAKSIESLVDAMEIERAEVSKAFLASLAGCFFYAPPHKGLRDRSDDLLEYVFGGLTYSKELFADLCLDSPKLNKLSEDFKQARGAHVKLMALVEGDYTRGIEFDKTRSSSNMQTNMQTTVVPQASMLEFASSGTVSELKDSNHTDVCKPINKKHPAYKNLVEFIGDILYDKEVIQDLSGDKRPVDMLTQ